MNHDVLNVIGIVLLEQSDYASYTRMGCCSRFLYDSYKSNIYKYIKRMNETLSDIRRILLKCNHGQGTCDLVISALQKFSRIVKSISGKNTSRFIEEHFSVLKSIKVELSFYIERFSDASKKSQLLQFRNEIFLSKLKTIDIVDEARQTTKLFNEFIKGITYFSTQTGYGANQPIYHRKGSCTKKGQKNKKCKAGEPNETTPEEIYSCYLERMIYDLIWLEKMGHQQDKNHIEWLEDTRKAFLSCFPTGELKVDIRFNDRRTSNDDRTARKRHIVPTHLTVILFRKGNEIWQESYFKSYDDDERNYMYPVECERIQGMQRFVKSSTFDDKGTWRAHQSGGKKMFKSATHR